MLDGLRPTERPCLIAPTAWLIAQKVLLPGVTTLERNIARVRARAGQRLWRQMLMGMTFDQRERLETRGLSSNGTENLHKVGWLIRVCDEPPSCGLA